MDPVCLVSTPAFSVLDVAIATTVASDTASSHNDALREAFYSISSLRYDDAVQTSYEEREFTACKENWALTYGETTFEAVCTLFDRLNRDWCWPAGVRTGDSVFVDLGSGAGRVVYSAAMLRPFRKCVGIEMLASLHDIAVATAPEYSVVQRMWSGAAFANEVQFFLGSMFDLELFEWTEADVVFTCSACFSDDMLRQLAACGSRMKRGSLFITLTQALPRYTRHRFEMLFV